MVVCVAKIVDPMKVTHLVNKMLFDTICRLGWESALQALSTNQQQQQQQQQHQSDLKKSSLAQEDLMFKMDGR